MRIWAMDWQWGKAQQLESQDAGGFFVACEEDPSGKVEMRYTYVYMYIYI